MSWQAIKGHEAIAAGFARAAARGRLAHGYLFVGPPGIGKRLFARQLAKTLLCETPVEPWDSCDRCASCKLVDAGAHPDLFEVARPEDKLEFPIESIRQLCHDLALKPARGSRKFAILDDADDLNEESANSFLKTLEEPPPGSILILIGVSADRQLPTIRSRCQVVSFKPLAIPFVESLLRAGGDIDEEQIARLARLGGGSVRLARDLAIPGLWELRTRLLAALHQPRVDAGDLAKAWMDHVEEAGKDAGAQRRRATLVIRLLVQGLEAALAGTDDADPGLRSLGPDRLMDLIERCMAAAEQIDRRVQLILVVEALVDALNKGVRNRY